MITAQNTRYKAELVAFNAEGYKVHSSEQYGHNLKGMINPGTNWEDRTNP